MVVNRILEWYRSGINPQDRLPFLATYLGHRDIHSTLVYITVTQDLLQHASERFRLVGAPCLNLAPEAQPWKEARPVPRAAPAFDQLAGRAAQRIGPHRSVPIATLGGCSSGSSAERQGCKVAQITLADLTGPEVGAFLQPCRARSTRARSGRATAGSPRYAASSTSWRPKSRRPSHTCTEILGNPGQASADTGAGVTSNRWR